MSQSGRDGQQLPLKMVVGPLPPPALCRLCPKDPLLAHERGCVALRAGSNGEAEEFLRQALHLAQGGLHVGELQRTAP